jgi:hypothetical protein
MTRDTGDNVDFLNNRPRRGEGVRRLNRVPLLIAGLMLLLGGFAVDRIELIPRPTPLPTDMAGWLDTFGDSFFGRFDPGERSAARAEVLDLLRPCLCDKRGRWTVDYVRLRFAAHTVED